MKSSSQKGYISELKVFSKLLEYGDISVPYGNSSRYDCIFDYNNKLYKIQIKTGRRVDENRFFVPLSNSKVSSIISTHKKYSPNDIDFVIAYYDDEYYIIPIKEEHDGINLSYKHSQHKKQNINLAEDYKLEKILKQLKEQNI